MPQARRRLIRLSTWCIGLALFLAFAVEASSVLIGHNLHVVVPGRVYRCAQPYGNELQHDIEQYGIRTVINLRGVNSSADWYLAESRATANKDVCQEDITFSSGRLPDPLELRRLVEVLDKAEYPVMIHCRRGVDRTGLTSTLIQMLYEGITPEIARAQLSYRFGHFPWGRTAAMLRFFDLYERWLARTQLQHSATSFREFLVRGYCPGPARGRVESVSSNELVVGQASVVQVRAINTSDEDWRLKAGTGSGIHLRYRVFDGAGNELQAGAAGLFAATVPPGGDVVLKLPINRLPAPGAYTLRADLLDGPDIAFMQLGGDEFVMELTAR